MRQLPRWVVLCALALATVASAEEPQWTPEEITDKFDEVDKKLRDIRRLDSKDRTTTRRILEVESDVRELRGSLKTLELRLHTLEEALKSMGGDLAAVRKIADKAFDTAVVAGRPKPAVGTTTPVEPTGPPAEILDEQARAEGGFRTITGSVRNRTDRALTFVLVQATFVDANGHTVKTESVYTAPRVIPPNGSATFRVYTRDDSRIRRHRLELQAK